jgi:hypothetical protein
MTRVVVALLALAVVGCDQSPPATPGAPDTGLALARSGRAKDSLVRVKDSIIAEKSRQLSLQSQLIGDAATSARLVSEIDADLAKVRGLRAGRDTLPTEGAEANASEQLFRVQRKVSALISRLNASEARVRRMRNDSTTHASFDSTQVAQLREYERSINELRGTVERQQLEIAVLGQRVDSVVKVNVDLTAQNTVLTARTVAMAAYDDSVYLAIGTERDLISRGIAREEGGNRLLFGIGRTLVPARALDPSKFRAISKSHDLSIPLPRSDKRYRLVSRHNLAYTEAANQKDGLLRGSLRITDTSAFWQASKFLILVER